MKSLDLSSIEWATPVVPSKKNPIENILTPENISFPRTYTEVQELSPAALSQPGLAPFLKGPYPTMYLSSPWTVRQYAGFSTAQASNEFYRKKSLQ